jgi:tetratricopeptide (TPR) repeat protein
MKSFRLNFAASVFVWLALAASAGAAYESPAAALERASPAGSPGPGAAAEAWADAGWSALFVENDYEKARGYFEQALALKPTLAPALEGLGRTLEISGDYSGALRAYLEFLAAAPDHPAAYIYLHRCHVLEEDTDGRDFFLQTLHSLRNRDDVPPAIRAKATLFLFDRAHRAADFDEAETLLSSLNFVRDWQIVGPFDNEGKEGFDDVYPPENGISLAATYDGKARDVRWRRLPVALPTGFLDFTTVLAPAEKSVAYAAVAVNSPARRDAFIALAAAGAVKVWLNGVEVFARDAYHEGYFDQYVAPASLLPGYNLLLVKVCGDDERWGFGARFLGNDGEPLADVTFDAGGAALAAASHVVGLSPPPHDNLDYFDRRILEGAADAFDYYYAALAHYARADADENEEVPTKLMLAAQSIMPETADFYYYIGVTEKEESRIRASLTKTLKLAPQHNQARLALAKYFYDLERPQAALDVIDDVLNRNATFVEAEQYRAKLYWESGYAYDAARAAGDISRRLPNYPFSKMVTALFEMNYGDLARATELWRTIYDADVYSTNARDELFRLLLTRDDFEGATAVMRRALEADPYDVGARKKSITALNHYGLYAQALAEAESALSFRPEDYELWRYRGSSLDELGRETPAREAYRKAVTFKRNYPTLENYLNYLEPASERRAVPRLDAYEVLAAYPGDDLFPRDSAVWLLDDRQVEVFENGTSTRTVHYVVKILTAEGAEKFRNVNVSYSPGLENVELKRTAVLKADGTEITANQIREYNVFDVWSRLYYSYVNKVITMPNLSPGDTIDIEYKISQTGENLFAGYFGDFYYFGHKNSTILARYAVSVPKNKKYYFERVRGAPAPGIVRGGGTTTYVYRMENLPAIEEEPYMPALAEVLPSVQVSNFASWNEVGRWYNGLIKDVFRPSPPAETLAAKLAADEPDDLTKLQRVYDFAVSRIRYVGLEFGIGGYRPHSPKQCLESHYGDCKDKATLMNTLYRLMGFEAYPAMIRTAGLGELDYELPILGLFNHMISYVKLPDGRTFFLDGTAEYHSYRELPAGDQGIDALVIFGDRASFVRTPVLPLEDNRIRTRTSFVLQPGGDAHVHRVVEYGAADAPYQRERFRVEAKRRAVIEEYWNGLYPGTKVFNEKFSDINDLAQPVRVEYDAVVKRLYDPASARVHLEAVVHKSNLLARYGKKASRRWPLILRENEKAVAELTYFIPEGYAVTALPLAKEFRSRFGILAIDVRTEGNRVLIKQEFELHAQRIPPSDYAAFREFCLNVDDWENEPIIIEKVR